MNGRLHGLGGAVAESGEDPPCGLEGEGEFAGEEDGEYWMARSCRPARWFP